VQLWQSRHPTIGVPHFILRNAAGSLHTFGCALECVAPFNAVGMTKSHRWGLLALLLFLLFCVTGLNVLLSYAGDLALCARLRTPRDNITYQITNALVLDESKHLIH
jgi:hypothetical protein